MSLTRKNFREFAATFAAALKAPNANRAAVLAQIETAITICKQSNPRFDSDRFRSACGIASLPPIRTN